MLTTKTVDEWSSCLFSRHRSGVSRYILRGYQKRLEQLEAKRAEQERAEHQAWVESLSDAELDALIAEEAERDPVTHAAVEALSDADLERLDAGTMPNAEWQQHLQRAQERLNAAA